MIDFYWGGPPGTCRNWANSKVGSRTFQEKVLRDTCKMAKKLFVGEPNGGW